MRHQCENELCTHIKIKKCCRTQILGAFVSSANLKRREVVCVCNERNDDEETTNEKAKRNETVKISAERKT